MSHERLNALAMLSIEKDLLVKYNIIKDLISTFASQKVRKINFK